MKTNWKPTKAQIEERKHNSREMARKGIPARTSTGFKIKFPKSWPV